MSEDTIDITDETVLHRNPNIIASQIDGETVMMDEEFDSYYGMKKVGTFIWSQLDEGITFGDLVARLNEAAGETVAEDKCREETLAFLHDLHENSLLKIGGE